MKSQGRGNVTPRVDEQPQYIVHLAALRAVQPQEEGFVIVLYGSAPGDGGGGLFYASTGQAPETYVDDGATVIVPAGGDGSSAWLVDSESVVIPPPVVEVDDDYTITAASWGAADPRTAELTIVVTGEAEEDAGVTVTLPSFSTPSGIINGTRIRVVKNNGDFAVEVANEGVPGVQNNTQGGLGNSLTNATGAGGAINNPRWQVSLEMRNGDWVWYRGVPAVQGAIYSLDLQYSNLGSGLTATNVQDAIDELKALIDALP